MEVTFEVEKQTKGTFRYKELGNSLSLDEELGDAPAIGTLYVRKWALEALAQEVVARNPDQAAVVPQRLKVTVEVIE